MQFDRITPVTVAVRSSRGKVDIVAADDTAVQVDVVALDGSDTSAEAARNTRVELEGDTLFIEPPHVAAWQWRRSPKLGISVRVPTGSSIAAKTASADLRAGGRYAGARVSVASGDAWVDEVTGDAHISSASGDLAIGRVGGNLQIKSASGDVEVGDVTGDVRANSASGDITVRSGGASLSADTASGDVQIGVVRQGKVHLKSASGDVEVGVAAGTGVWLDVGTASGSTTNDLAMGGGNGAAQGSAALELQIRTASGDIHIRRVTGDVPAATV
jgi:DUF4097 and DUF4098 domain-containing protein YvlB